ncbi:MAG: radical SAM protein [Sandaracinaceae bacterium]
MTVDKVLFVFFNHPPTPFNASVAALSAVARELGVARAALSIPLTSTVAEAAARVDAEGADVVVVTAMTRDWPAARAVLERIDPAPFRMVGGYHASLAPRHVAACAAVDAIGIGDGERPLRAVLERGRPTASIPGLWVRGPDGFAGEPPPPDPEPDIAALPAYDYEVFGDVGAMLDRGINTFGPLADRYLPTRASRGCPYRCAYCSAPTWARVAGHASARRNVRPVPHLLDELAALRDRHAPEGFELWDEHFPVDLAWLDELAAAYPRRVGLPFKVEMHPSAATRERLARLAEAGCVLFHCGVEAGDATLRRETLNRRTSDAVLERVFDDCRELGLATSASVMTALPGETLAQARKTIALLRRLRPDSFMWSTYMALPFTPLGDRARERFPEPARERLDDWSSPPSKTPSAMTDEERRLVHAELSALQQALVGEAKGEDHDARERPLAVPVDRPPSSPSPAREGGPGKERERSLTLPPTPSREREGGSLQASYRPPSSPTPARGGGSGWGREDDRSLTLQGSSRALVDLAAALGFAPPDAALDARFRLNRATREHGELHLEIERAGVPAHVVTIGPVDGRPAFVDNGALRFAHRGREAPRAVLDELGRLARTLRALPC